MLNHARILKYIKSNLGFPFQHLELEDEFILDHITEFTLREFSQYVPEKKIVSIELDLLSNKVPNIENEFYITDPQNIEILNVIDIYTSQANLFIFGHPFFGPFSHFELREWALATEMANQVKQFSSFDITFEFKHPNIVRISPKPTQSYCLVEYERIQPKDLRGIPNEFQVLFCELALADIMIVLGRIRKKYGDGNMHTPFGDVPVGVDIFDEGTNKKRELIEKLDRLFIPNVSVDFG